MLGVVIGRFQTPYLHEGHLQLLKYARNKSDKLLILIGVSSATGTDRDPMDFETRKGLFQTNDIVLMVYDMPSDIDWTKQVDSIIEHLGFKEATIFGSKDNAIEGHYLGKHPINIMLSTTSKSATEIRKNITVKYTQAFREGIIYQTQKRYPIVYSTVDVIIRNSAGEYLVGRKGDKYAFVGGFVDKEDASLLQAAERELKEETAIETSLRYFDSIKIADPRYSKTKDSIMTHIFLGRWDKLPNSDEIQDLEFKDFKFVSKDLIEGCLQECHKPIFHLVDNLSSLWWGNKIQVANLFELQKMHEAWKKDDTISINNYK
jgi:bifunctional NMN adenylyltransferase/nudix hydrolase